MGYLVTRGKNGNVSYSGTQYVNPTMGTHKLCIRTGSGSNDVVKYGLTSNTSASNYCGLRMNVDGKTAYIGRSDVVSSTSVTSNSNSYTTTYTSSVNYSTGMNSFIYEYNYNNMCKITSSYNTYSVSNSNSSSKYDTYSYSSNLGTSMTSNNSYTHSESCMMTKEFFSTRLSVSNYTATFGAYQHALSNIYSSFSEKKIILGTKSSTSTIITGHFGANPLLTNSYNYFYYDDIGSYRSSYNSYSQSSYDDTRSYSDSISKVSIREKCNGGIDREIFVTRQTSSNSNCYVSVIKHRDYLQSKTLSITHYGTFYYNSTTSNNILTTSTLHPSQIVNPNSSFYASNFFTDTKIPNNQGITNSTTTCRFSTTSTYYTGASKNTLYSSRVMTEYIGLISYGSTITVTSANYKSGTYTFSFNVASSSCSTNGYSSAIQYTTSRELCSFSSSIIDHQTVSSTVTQTGTASYKSTSNNINL